MSNLRVLVARALTSCDLTSSDIQETALDRIAALAFSDPLGTSLWRLKYAAEAKQAPRSAYLLARRSRSTVDEPELRWRLCRLTIDEWLSDACEACEGRRFIMATSAEVMRVCNVCLGTGVKRHSDQSRMARMRWEPRVYRKWESRFAALHQKIADADVRVWRQVAKQLGWFAPVEVSTRSAMLYTVSNVVQARAL